MKTTGNANKKFLRNLSNQYFQEMIDYCWQNRGAKADVHRRINKLLPEPLPKIQISNWLNANPLERSTPTYPAGVLLLKVWQEMRPK
jgi:cytochrome c1